MSIHGLPPSGGNWGNYQAGEPQEPEKISSKFEQTIPVNQIPDAIKKALSELQKDPANWPNIQQECVNAFPEDDDQYPPGTPFTADAICMAIEYANDPATLQQALNQAAIAFRVNA